MRILGPGFASRIISPKRWACIIRNTVAVFIANENACTTQGTDPNMAKILILTGIIMITTGILLQFAPTIPWLGKLPGDMHIRNENFSFHFPITTCIIISIFLSLIFYLLGRR